jgi:hypothetical protein
MFRNRNILFVLILVLAVSSFGFTNGSSTGIVIREDGGQPNYKCPAGYLLEKVRRTIHGQTRWYPACVKPTGIVNNDTSFIQDNLVTVKVTPELAAALALFEQPAGTVVTNVSQLYTGTIPPYYEVTIVNGNYVKAVYIDARNGSILPPQYNHPNLLPNIIYLKK